MQDIKFRKKLFGLEDGLFSATDPKQVKQLRAGVTVQVTKINIDTLPAVGELGDTNFKSIRNFIDESINGDNFFVTNEYGGFGLVVGDGGLDWDGNVPNSNEISLVQKLDNGKYRWVIKSTLGSDNWAFRGRVSGTAGIQPNDFITKGQLDDVAKQSDWKQENIGKIDYIKNKPTIPTLATPTKEGIGEQGTATELTTGTSSVPMLWSAKDLKDFSKALSSGGGAKASNINGLAPNRVTLPFSKRGYEGLYADRVFNGKLWFVATKTGSLNVLINLPIYGQSQFISVTDIRLDRIKVFEVERKQQSGGGFGKRPVQKLNVTVPVKKGQLVEIVSELDTETDEYIYYATLNVDIKDNIA